jgi:hypothetical protein
MNELFIRKTMRRIKLFLPILISLYTSAVLTQCGKPTSTVSKSDSMGIVICSNDPEAVWNARRFANYSKSQGDPVSIFLLGKGVELENLNISDAIIIQ